MMMLFLMNIASERILPVFLNEGGRKCVRKHLGSLIFQRVPTVQSTPPLIPAGGHSSRSQPALCLHKEPLLYPEEQQALPWAPPYLPSPFYRHCLQLLNSSHSGFKNTVCYKIIKNQNKQKNPPSYYFLGKLA